MPTPDLTRWPNADDVETMLTSSGFWPTTTDEQALATTEAGITTVSAVDEFESRTGWYPFLGDSEDSERTFEIFDERGVQYALPGALLLLQAGLLSFTSCTINGQAAVLNQGVFMRPATAAHRGRPWQALFFPQFQNSRYVGQRQMTIVVTGKWGFCTTVPADAWTSVLRYAAVQTLSVTNVPQDLASLSQDGLSKAWDVVGAIQPKDILNNWSKELAGTCERYKRRV